MNHTAQVALVGGSQDASHFRNHLERHGVGVCTHNPKIPLRVPQKATHIVVLRNGCSHKLFDQAQEVAKRRGLQLTAVWQSWAKAEPLLRQHGLLSEPGPQKEEAVRVFPPKVAPKAPQPKDRLLAELQAKVVGLEASLDDTKKKLGEAEEMLIERDDEVIKMSEQLAELCKHFRALEARVRESTIDPLVELSLRERAEMFTETLVTLREEHGDWSDAKTKEVAARKAGFGSYGTAYRASRVFRDGSQGLCDRVSSGNLSINAAYRQMILQPAHFDPRGQ